MNLYQEDGSEATFEAVVAWLVNHGEEGEFPNLSLACEEVAGAFLTCSERCGLERFVNYLVGTVQSISTEAVWPEGKQFPWEQHGSSELLPLLLDHYQTTTLISSDKKNIAAALEKIGSSRVLTEEERSGYPY